MWTTAVWAYEITIISPSTSVVCCVFAAPVFRVRFRKSALSPYQRTTTIVFITIESVLSGTSQQPNHRLNGMRMFPVCSFSSSPRRLASPFVCCQSSPKAQSLLTQIFNKRRFNMRCLSEMHPSVWSLGLNKWIILFGANMHEPKPQSSGIDLMMTEQWATQQRHFIREFRSNWNLCTSIASLIIVAIYNPRNKHTHTHTRATRSYTYTENASNRQNSLALLCSVLLSSPPRLAGWLTDWLAM